MPLSSPTCLDAARTFLHAFHGAPTMQAIDDYRGQVARDERGAVLLAVCQGRVSEGIDFSDDEGRTVVVAGIPFPPAKDARVLCKKQVVDDRRRRGQGTLTGAGHPHLLCVLCFCAARPVPPVVAGDGELHRPAVSRLAPFRCSDALHCWSFPGERSQPNAGFHPFNWAG